MSKQNDAPVAIELEHVSYKVGTKPLLQDVCWRVEQGERWLVYGDNGSGKTTLLSLLAGYGQLYAGRCRVLGQAYTAQNVFALRRRVGWISTSFFDKYYRKESVSNILLSGLSGSLGVRFALDLAEVKAARVELARFGILDKFDSLYCMLSKGEQQKVLLARALLQKPELLLLDEPLSGLDASSEHYVKSLLREIAAQAEVTMVYVSHHPEEFAESIQYRLRLQHGKRVE